MPKRIRSSGPAIAAVALKPACTARPAVGAAAQANASRSRVTSANSARRMCGASSSSKNSSSSSARARSAGSDGYSGGSGWLRSSASMMRVESPIVSPFIFSTGNVDPRVIANAQTVWIIGIGALRMCGMRL